MMTMMSGGVISDNMHSIK